MRIALVTYSTRPRGGVVHTLALAEAMAALGADVTVWGIAPEPGEGFFRAVDPQVAVRLADRAPTATDDVDARVLASIDALGAAIDPADYDIVHAQDCISANAVPGCVRTVHHLDQFTSPALAECHERAIVEPFAHVCVSARVAEELRAGWGIDARVIANGVAAERFAAAVDDEAGRAAWRARVRDADPFVLTVGGIEPRKGTLELVEAIAALRDGGHPRTRLVIAGGETLFDYRPYRAQVQARCEELGIEPVVLGAIDDHELPALVATCDVFALLSTKEGFGMAAMEALAARRPVVLSDLPVFREVFGEAASFGDLESALAAPPDPEIGARLAAAHTWEGAARAHLKLYEAIG
ncbi:MAG: MSMEG_0565 family glycosyltransferase [Solirubrobacteraceae bacterium]